MNEIIKKDLYRYAIKKTDLFSLIQAFKYPGFSYMYFLRKAHDTKRLSVKWIYYRLIIRHLSYKFGFQIPILTKIGEGFFIDHFGSIIISYQAVIGKNCNITHGVTIGRISNGIRKGAPEIGDYVWMGTNCIIVGNVKIGSNVLIAPGAYVNFDVPENSIVIGNPGKIIEKDNPTQGYINNVM